ncbi:MAG: hypothetical protein JXA73_00555, partial [Acidobacteria bacterium]|nr:hypothetical protein [Acidobacteriota bacterium]
GFVSQPLRGCLPGPPLSFQSQMYKLQVAASAATCWCKQKIRHKYLLHMGIFAYADCVIATTVFNPIVKF